MADLDAIEALPVVGWYVAGDDGDRVPMLASDRDALVAVVRAARGIAERFADEEALAGSPLKSLRDALAPFKEADDA